MITIYTNPNCAQCDQTKRFLEKNKIKYEARMLADSPEIQPLIEQRGYRVAPIVVTSDDDWSGFKIDKLNEYVEKELGF